MRSACKEMTSESEPPERSQAATRWIGLLIATAALPLYFLFREFGQENVGYVVACVTVVFLAVIYVKRASALKPRFVLEVGSLYLIHIVVISLLPLPPSIPSYVMIPASLADGVVVLAILHLLNDAGWASGN